MFLESDYTNDDRIRRKAYPVDNPLQAKRSSGYRNPSLPQNSVGVQLLPELKRGGRRMSFHPELQDLRSWFWETVMQNTLLWTGYKSVNINDTAFLRQPVSQINEVIPDETKRDEGTYQRTFFYILTNLILGLLPKMHVIACFPCHFHRSKTFRRRVRQRRLRHTWCQTYSSLLCRIWTGLPFHFYGW